MQEQKLYLTPDGRIVTEESWLAGEGCGGTKAHILLDRNAKPSATNFWQDLDQQIAGRVVRPGFPLYKTGHMGGLLLPGCLYVLTGPAPGALLALAMQVALMSKPVTGPAHGSIIISGRLPDLALRCMAVAVEGWISYPELVQGILPKEERVRADQALRDLERKQIRTHGGAAYASIFLQEAEAMKDSPICPAILEDIPADLREPHDLLVADSLPGGNSCSTMEILRSVAQRLDIPVLATMPTGRGESLNGTAADMAAEVYVLDPMPSGEAEEPCYQLYAAGNAGEKQYLDQDPETLRF